MHSAPPMAETRLYPYGGAGYTATAPMQHYQSEELLTGQPPVTPRKDASSCWRRKYRPCGRLCPCCCCSCCCCCLVLLLLAVAIGLTAFFVWPRIPQVTFLDIKPISLPSGIDLTTSMLGSLVGGSKPLSFTSEWEVSVAVDSPNYIGWHFDKVSGVLIDPPTGRVVGTGNLTDYTLPARANTTVTLPVQLIYKASAAANTAGNNDGGGGGGILGNIIDPMLTRVIAACQQKKKIPMTLKLSFLVPVIRWFGEPDIERTISIPCPIQMPSL
ncbi:hypothetical protein SYNPS1DRAFT_29475 [Syncephalis pseudoplumigaleata]|uniref:Late embryogenesis abundant protein LEA-2 subgroup domain-containing protein n=1 Tax=Syncephalis pseudoplumigaleata TaxID=1712513 RepID=A0A4P9YXM9_9FUNG|nr:hypothetical protein SYNPS1DRAFT_29475 [Syncephalis pseudoplumigaleata]|eukprot:RKP24774.1 hypothetical protein SYNPS1DRAFT_29475 [Syncephalis pseudoplumigaleata]